MTLPQGRLQEIGWAESINPGFLSFSLQSVQEGKPQWKGESVVCAGSSLSPHLGRLSVDQERKQCLQGETGSTRCLGLAQLCPQEPSVQMGYECVCVWGSLESFCVGFREPPAGER